MNRGANVSQVLPSLARSKGFSQAKLEDATGIDHSTMSRYWSGRGGLGEKNAAKIARVLDVEISDLGLTAEAAAGDDLSDLRHTLAALEETVRLLTLRVGELEHTPAAPRRGASTRKRKAV
jgi:transcriptional regulator with XRE-family HTH domain